MSITKEKGLEYVDLFRGRVKQYPCYETFLKFRNGLHTLPFEKASGIHIPRPYRDLMQLDFVSKSCDTANEINQRLLIEWYGHEDALERFFNLCHEHEKDMLAMIDLLKERLPEGEWDKLAKVPEEPAVAPPAPQKDSPSMEQLSLFG